MLTVGVRGQTLERRFRRLIALMKKGLPNRKNTNMAAKKTHAVTTDNTLIHYGKYRAINFTVKVNYNGSGGDNLW